MPGGCSASDAGRADEKDRAGWVLTAQVEKLSEGKPRTRGQREAQVSSVEMEVTHTGQERGERPSHQDHRGVAGSGGAKGIMKRLTGLPESEAERSCDK